MCASCGQQVSVTAGTIFQDTRSPLTVWFRAIWWVVSQKNGASALLVRQRTIHFVFPVWMSMPADNRGVGWSTSATRGSEERRLDCRRRPQAPAALERGF